MKAELAGKIKLVVYNEHTLGYILPELPSQVNILHASILKGAPFALNKTSEQIGGNDKVRLACAKDFDDYRVDFEGYKNDPEYEYSVPAQKSISQIKQESQDKQSELFTLLGVFFAFSNQQFGEQKKDGVNYTNLGCGMIAPRENVEEIIAGMDAIDKWTGEELRRNVSADKYILDALCNYECFYTGDISDALEDAKNYYPDCTYESVRQVYSKYSNDYSY